jgi:hypothetical protein
MQKIQSWIDECTNTHEQCRRRRNNLPYAVGEFVPRRLITFDNIQSGVVRLVSPRTHVRYAALSYRWGDTKPLVTTRSNVQSHYQRIISTDLPQSVQDALLVAQALDLQYLWVDALYVNPTVTM